ARARQLVEEHYKGAPPPIRIAQIDTGIRYEHAALAGTRIAKELARSFLPGEEHNPAIDELSGERVGRAGVGERIQRLAEQDYHGTATLALLAGGTVTTDVSYDNYAGPMGAIPFAEIVPLRISETVALTGLLGNSREFAEAVHYAIDIGCRVITMSMAGAPSRAWAKAVNRAYENGVVIVSAAGNSFPRGAGRLSPTKVLYPARFARVIAATGVTFNKEPYVEDFNSHRRGDHKSMQGNFGPRRAMDTALAAYTPNVPWAQLDEQKRSVILRTGAGTSSATPQVAAAAALYLSHYRQTMILQYGEKPNWQWAEATRQALFQSADAEAYAQTADHLGRGSLKAASALDIPPPPVADLDLAPSARIFSGAVSFLRLAFRKGVRSLTDTVSPEASTLQEMVCLEAQQILHRDPALVEYADALEFDAAEELTDQEQARVLEALEKAKASPLASDFFRQQVDIY
ncbi:MAG: S8/S53 family peptidase, partial [Bacteroidota bacterium]